MLRRPDPDSLALGTMRRIRPGYLYAVCPKRHSNMRCRHPEAEAHSPHAGRMVYDCECCGWFAVEEEG